MIMSVRSCPDINDRVRTGPGLWSTRLRDFPTCISGKGPHQFFYVTPQLLQPLDLEFSGFFGQEQRLPELAPGSLLIILAFTLYNTNNSPDVTGAMFLSEGQIELHRLVFQLYPGSRREASPGKQTAPGGMVLPFHLDNFTKRRILT